MKRLGNWTEHSKVKSQKSKVKLVLASNYVQFLAKTQNKIRK